MLAIKNTLISDDLYLVKFCCDIQHCKGACCVEGDAGAPLEEEEIGIIEDFLEYILPYMTDEGKETIAQKGVFDYDEDGQYVTPLNNDSECAFTNFKDGIAYCAIEEAYDKGEIDFRKPVSCHLYPIRIAKVGEDEAVNYHNWHICNKALEKGKETGLAVYEFCREALIRKYGEGWYEELLMEIKKT